MSPVSPKPTTVVILITNLTSTFSSYSSSWRHECLRLLLTDESLLALAGDVVPAAVLAQPHAVLVVKEIVRLLQLPVTELGQTGSVLKPGEPPLIPARAFYLRERETDLQKVLATNPGATARCVVE